MVRGGLPLLVRGGCTRYLISVTASFDEQSWISCRKNGNSYWTANGSHRRFGSVRSSIWLWNLLFHVGITATLMSFTVLPLIECCSKGWPGYFFCTPLVNLVVNPYFFTGITAILTSWVVKLPSFLITTDVNKCLFILYLLTLCLEQLRYCVAHQLDVKWTFDTYHSQLWWAIHHQHPLEIIWRLVCSVRWCSSAGCEMFYSLFISQPALMSANLLIFYKAYFKVRVLFFFLRSLI